VELQFQKLRFIIYAKLRFIFKSNNVNETISPKHGLN